MPSHYDTLQVGATASDVEVRSAAEALYNHYLTLINHHDPQQASQAQQMLRVIEEARTVLLNPSQRQRYDTEIGVGGLVGGLSDPSAAPDSAQAVPVTFGISARQTPTQKPVVPTPATASTITSLWTCPKCQMVNEPRTKFCGGCGFQLIVACLRCKQETAIVATERCTSCGANQAEERRSLEARKAAAQRRQEIEDVFNARLDQIAEKRRAVSTARKQVEEQVSLDLQTYKPPFPLIPCMIGFVVGALLIFIRDSSSSSSSSFEDGGIIAIVIQAIMLGISFAFIAVVITAGNMQSKHESNIKREYSGVIEKQKAEDQQLAKMQEAIKHEYEQAVAQLEHQNKEIAASPEALG